jgi:hypothetical protein
VRGEFGVSYLQDPEAPKRIKKHFPNTKILITLRNPVDMLYSLYWYNVNTVEARMPKTFEKAVNEEWCLDRGNYSKYVDRFYKLFPKKNIHIVIFDDIKDNPRKVVEGLYEFLAVDKSFLPSVLGRRVYSSIGHRIKLFKKLGYLFFKTLRIFGLEKVRRFILDNPIFYSVYYSLNVVSKKYPKMSAKMRRNLKAYYKKDIEKLENLLDRDLSVWK